jgi:tetratricopeptide (TPR) repeat protein
MHASEMTADQLAAEATQHLALVFSALKVGDVLAASDAVRSAEQWVVSSVRDPLTQARILYDLAELLDDAGLREQAQARFERSLAISQALEGRLARLGAGLSLERLGAIHRDAERFAEAIACYRQAIEHFSIVGNTLGIGKVWNNIGLAHHRAGDLKSAEESYRQAATMAKSAGEARLYATSLGNLGKVALDRYRFAEAEQQLRAAIELTRTLDNPALLTSQLGDLGSVLRATGQSAAAARSYEEALQLSEAHDDQRGQQLALGNLGAIYWECGELSRAMLHLERAYNISKKHGSAADQITDLTHLALLHLTLHEPERADERLQTALRLAEEAAPGLLPGVLTTLGHQALENGDLDQAARYYQRCLAVEEQIGETYNVGTSWLNLGYVAREQGNVEQAIAYWRRSVELHEAAGNRSGLATAHLNLGGVLQDNDDFAAAELHLHAALEIAESFPLPDDARQTWESLALLRWRQGDLIGARQAYAQAIVWAERSRTATVGQGHRIGLWRHLERPYFHLIQLCRATHDWCSMWEAVEQARSRALAELLAISVLPAPAHLPTTLRERQDELLAHLRHIRVALTTEPSSGADLAELLDVSRDLETLWAEMETLSPEYVMLRRGNPAGWNGIRDLLRGDAGP